MNLIDVTRELGTEEQCLAYLEAQRWPDGVRCPVCGNDKISRVTRQSATKNKRKQIYTCLEPTCKNQFSATTGTIFHDSHVPLTKWFMAIALISDAKKSLSANQLKQHLGLGSYRTAWYMMHRIRKAMADPFPTKLAGVVEVDETYIGGKAKIRGRKRSKVEKDMVLGMVERGGRVRYFHIPDGKLATIKPLLDRHIRTDVRQIVTDQAVVYDFAMDKDFKRKHRTVNHSETYVSADGTHTNTIESAFSLLKRGLIGSFHRVSIKHLHRYLSEFEYRFNGRKEPNLFGRVVSRMVTTPHMEYKQLTARA